MEAMVEGFGWAHQEQTTREKRMKLLKVSLLMALAMGALLAGTTLVNAQDNKEGKKGPPPGGRAAMGQRIADELNLTDDQKPKFREAMENQFKQMRELRDDTSLSQEQRQEKMKTIREDTDKKIKEILTADQYTKYEKLRDEMRARKGGPDGKGEKKGKKKQE
jgi:periplasmic protein CpxP/Spy